MDTKRLSCGGDDLSCQLEWRYFLSFYPAGLGIVVSLLDPPPKSIRGLKGFIEFHGHESGDPRTTIQDHGKMGTVYAEMFCQSGDGHRFAHIFAKEFAGVCWIVHHLYSVVTHYTLRKDIRLNVKYNRME
ncbi:hypothetical protein AciX8_3919 [Granulicella mallensis MP5ACTX8]|uniref:Uncharacterized protein n=1 Tax=Granulicella mallensis (strain ATCC BAA-1857 / DSM 23137 / MP5ACTX8) TaxID=682795 RepID=G8P256_GRAMM|nr:hypothetical protein AciX8_3919 [Granulicella mallensis MP5ACTX8]